MICKIAALKNRFVEQWRELLGRNMVGGAVFLVVFGLITTWFFTYILDEKQRKDPIVMLLAFIVTLLAFIVMLQLGKWMLKPSSLFLITKDTAFCIVSWDLQQVTRCLVRRVTYIYIYIYTCVCFRYNKCSASLLTALFFLCCSRQKPPGIYGGCQEGEPSSG